jgi:uncharacterized iron-regulated protein
MRHLPFIVITALVTLQIAGCATPRYSLHAATNVLAQTAEPGDSPRELPMFAGCDGRALNWEDLLDAVAWAEIVILGEAHNDDVAHQVQLAVVEDAFDRWPRAMLSMEMLERDEQVLVEDYYDGIIDTDTFVRLTFSENWGGKGGWAKWYQPIVDAAMLRGNRLIAANAPRRYVRMARLQGYDAMRALPRERRAFFELPRSLPRSRYFERFSEVMSHIEEPDALEAMYRAQLVWDATMARSIVRLRPSRDAKVIHLVGRFHSDFEGGLVQEIRRHRPWSRILVVSMHQFDSLELREEDVGRADVVIYTGAPEEPDDPEDLDDPDDLDDLDDPEDDEVHLHP